MTTTTADTSAPATAGTPAGATDAEPARIEPNHKWIRGRIGDRTVVDSRSTLFVWEHRYYPQWYIPLDDVGAELRPTGEIQPSDNRGEGVINDLVIVGDDGTEQVLAGAAVTYPDSPITELRNRVRLSWDAMDRWMEEDVEVFVHPRSPYTRVDVLPSSRRVTVSIDGTVVARSDRPSILYETGLPPRYYLPPEDVGAVLTPTDTSTACPYKGVARYWSVAVDGIDHDDIVWGYDDPLPESAGVRGLVCFYNEKVDIELDGELLDRPKTKFS